MTRIEFLPSLLLLIALPVFCSGVTPDHNDPSPHQDLEDKPQMATQASNVHRTEHRSERRPFDKRDLLSKTTTNANSTAIMTSGVSTVVKRNHPPDVHFLKEARSPIFDFLAGCLDPSEASESISKEVMKTVSAAVSKDVTDSMLSSISSSVSSNVSAAVSSNIESSASVVLFSTVQALSSSLTSAVESARSAGFRDGRTRPSQPSQSQPSQNQPSQGQTSQSQTESSCAFSTSLYSTNGTSNVYRGLDLNGSKLAGIVVAVFFASSISSILATVFILRYRRERLAVTHEKLDSPGRSRVGKLCGYILSSRDVATRTAGHREPAKKFPSEFQRDKIALSSKKQPAKSVATQVPLTTPAIPGSMDHQIYPVSPLSHQPSDSFGWDLQNVSGVGHHRSERPSSVSLTNNAPLYKFSLERHPYDPESQGAQVVRVGNQETTLYAFPNARARQPFPGPSTVTDGGPGIRETSNGGEGGTATSANTRILSPPVVPLRFSSRNAYMIRPPTQNSMGSHWHNEAFLSAMDNGPTSHNHQFLQDQPFPPQQHAGLQSGTAREDDHQPVSRFSISTAPLSTLGYSTSSSSTPLPQSRYPPQPEIPALRPPPMPASPPPVVNNDHLQSPVPRRPNLADFVASMEPSTRRGI